MKTFASVGTSLGLLLAGCSAASAIVGSSTSGGTTTPDVVNQAAVGSPCTPMAVVDICAAAGLVCDPFSAQCRKPEMGEQCNLEVGCDASPPGLACVVADIDGTGASICLVRCLGSNSSSCPYGTSCYSNYCRLQAPASCVPGESCPLGDELEGQCLSDGESATCLAVGDVRGAYEPCNPYALNSQAEQLCGQGFICRATALTLGGFADAGFCFPLCGQGCPADQHCAQPGNAFYRICHPGSPCSIDVDTCPYDSVCIPDDTSTLGGGCLPNVSDALGIGNSCAPPSMVPETSPCQEGACLPVDGGWACTPLCNRAAGGQPDCLNGTCSPLGFDSTGYDVVGACR